jgi:hypothetical protein
MTLTICGGSKIYNIECSKIQYYFDRYKLLNFKGEKALVDDFDLTQKELLKMSNTDFVKYMVKRMKLASILIHLLGYFHEQIAKLYLKTILESNLDFQETSEAKPSNYTPAMIRLSNITWNGYTENNLKGFCPYEPLVRIRQLLDFPIEHFAIIEISDLCDLPSAPQIDDSETKEKKLYTRLLEIRPVLEAYEKYYIELCEYIELLCQKISNY